MKVLPSATVCEQFFSGNCFMQELGVPHIFGQFQANLATVPSFPSYLLLFQKQKKQGREESIFKDGTVPCVELIVAQWTSHETLAIIFSQCGYLIGTLLRIHVRRLQQLLSYSWVFHELYCKFMHLTSIVLLTGIIFLTVYGTVPYIELIVAQWTSHETLAIFFVVRVSDIFCNHTFIRLDVSLQGSIWPWLSYNALQIYSM